MSESCTRERDKRREKEKEKEQDKERGREAARDEEREGVSKGWRGTSITMVRTSVTGHR